jgi:hypothetical protein
VRIVAETVSGRFTLVEMDGGAGRVVNRETHGYVLAPAVESVLARGGWVAYTGTDAEGEARKLMDAAWLERVA